MSAFTDELFERELKTGYAWQKKVVEFFLSKGIPARTGEYSFRKNKSRIADYATEMDILMGDPKKPPYYAYLEVKSRDAHFTSVHDLPRYMRSPFVNTVRSWEAIKHKPPFAVVIVSQQTGAMLVIPTKYHHEWTQVRAFDKKRKIMDTFLACPPERVYPIEMLLANLRRAGICC